MFRPYSHIARQKFVKSFTHGYAQTVAAASQSSYAATTGNFPPFAHHPYGRFSAKSSFSQLHNALQAHAGSSGTSKAPSSSTFHADWGLAAYYAAWQQQQQQQQGNDGGDDAGWSQFQFVKRIEWKSPTVVEEEAVAPVETSESGNGSRPAPRSPPPEPENTRDVVNRVESGDIQFRADDLLAANSHVPSETREPSTSSSEVIEAAAPTPVTTPAIPNLDGNEASSSVTLTSQLPAESTVEQGKETASGSPAEKLESGFLGKETRLASPEAHSHAFLQHIAELHDQNRHAEVPGAFQAMLLASVTPTTDAYNALLTAAARVPATRVQAVQKAFDVYADMRRRRVAPDTLTYSILIELIASRALDVAKQQRSLNERQARYRLDGRPLFASHHLDRNILAEDDSWNIALRLFDISKHDNSVRAFPLATYQTLAALCAEYDRSTHLIGMYNHMERHQATPSARIFESMITAFAKSRDLVSAVECYNEYRTLAIADDSGQQAIIDRHDEQIYAALMAAYIMCGKPEGAVRFWDKIRQENASRRIGSAGERSDVLEQMAIPRAFVQEHLRLGHFADAFHWAESARLSPSIRHQALARVCIEAADHGEASVAARAFESLSPSVEQQNAGVAMLALSLRSGNVTSASTFWNILSQSPLPWSTALVEPSTMYALVLLSHGQINEALDLARQAYKRVRLEAIPTTDGVDAVEAIDESIEVIGAHMRQLGIVPSPSAAMDLMWTMIENGGLVTPVAIQILAGLGHQALSQLLSEDLILLAQIQSGLISRLPGSLDIASQARLASLMELIMASGAPVDQRTQSLVEQALGQICSSELGHIRPELVEHWMAYNRHVAQGTPTPSFWTQSPTVASPSPSVDSLVDPYETSTDHRGSLLVAEQLERNSGHSGRSQLKEALSILRNIRRASRHPSFATYAKLITAAAKENRPDVAREVHAMARADVPYLPQFESTRQGWILILDAMVSACLNTGDRPTAMHYHQELLDMGAAPSANTFGLYITTLKESTKTFDEATEAVKIFRRAKSEGVVPTSFLYNALIGKLGKARRIDDCLYYFGEMRGLGIVPTSVTYGTIVNALCRVSDEKFAEELFEEMESMPNYKPRPAPYNSLMQFFLTTKRDRSKVLAYYERMIARNIAPTAHTFKLLIDAYATLEPVDMASAEAVLGQIRGARLRPEAVHYASLIHARGCTLHDLDGAHKMLNDVLADMNVRPHACLFQAYIESLVANHRVVESEEVLRKMNRLGISMTAYIANALIHGWALEGRVSKAKAIYDALGIEGREPSTYEAMARAFLSAEDRESALHVVHELSTRGYPPTVTEKVAELVRMRPAMDLGNTST
jgi:pentatricopeptide repeat protein